LSPLSSCASAPHSGVQAKMFSVASAGPQAVASANAMMALMAGS
jgi:hypothetical protein